MEIETVTGMEVAVDVGVVAETTMTMMIEEEAEVVVETT